MDIRDSVESILGIIGNEIEFNGTEFFQGDKNIRTTISGIESSTSKIFSLDVKNHDPYIILNIAADHGPDGNFRQIWVYGHSKDSLAHVFPAKLHYPGNTKEIIGTVSFFWD